MKRLIRALPFVLCLCFMVSVFAVPANAMVLYNPADYITDVVVDGNTKTVFYTFDDFTPIYATLVNGDYVRDANGRILYESGDFIKQEYTTDLLSVAWQVYMTGSVGYNTVRDDTKLIDVSGIMPGASIDVTGYFHINFVGNQIPHDSINFTYCWGFICYGVDGSGQMLTTDPVTSTIPGGGTSGTNIDVSTAFTIPRDISYVLPYFRVELSDFDEDAWNFETQLRLYPLTMSCDVNMIYQQSQQMDAINNKLNDIDNKLDDINGVLNGDANVDAGVSDFSGANDTLSNAMQSAGVVMDAGSDNVSDIANSSVMAGTLASLGSGLTVAFSDEFQVNLCGMSFNPFTLWVTVIGGFSLIALMVAYIFRKRGGS